MFIHCPLVTHVHVCTYWRNVFWSHWGFESVRLQFWGSYPLIKKSCSPNSAIPDDCDRECPLNPLFHFLSASHVSQNPFSPSPSLFSSFNGQILAFHRMRRCQDGYEKSSVVFHLFFVFIFSWYILIFLLIKNIILFTCYFLFCVQFFVKKMMERTQ